MFPAFFHFLSLARMKVYEGVLRMRRASLPKDLRISFVPTDFIQPASLNPCIYSIALQQSMGRDCDVISCCPLIFEDVKPEGSNVLPVISSQAQVVVNLPRNPVITNAVPKTRWLQASARLRERILPQNGLPSTMILSSRYRNLHKREGERFKSISNFMAKLMVATGSQLTFKRESTGNTSIYTNYGPMSTAEVATILSVVRS